MPYHEVSGITLHVFQDCGQLPCFVHAILIDYLLIKWNGLQVSKKFFSALRASVWSKNNGGGGGGDGSANALSFLWAGFTDFVWTEGRFVYIKKNRQFLKVSGLVWTGPELRRNNYSGLDNEIRLRVGTGQPCSVILKQWNSCRISFIDFYLAFYKF